MAYIYAGLGIAMMTGVMAMFEFGLSITGQEVRLLPPVDSYFEQEGLSQRIADRDFLRLLNTPGVLMAMGDQSSQHLCNCLKCRVQISGSSNPEVIPGPLDQAQASASLCDDSVLTSPHCDGNDKIAQGYLFLNGYKDEPVNGTADEITFFSSACALTSVATEHRVLVKLNERNSVSPYELYSCNGSRCSFE